MKIQQQPGYYVICVRYFHFGTLLCITTNVSLCNNVRSDQGGSRNLFSMIKINYLMLLLFMTIRDNSVHTKVKNIKSTIIKTGTNLKDCTNFKASNIRKICTAFKAGTNLKVCANFKGGTNFKSLHFKM